MIRTFFNADANNPAQSIRKCDDLICDLVAGVLSKGLASVPGVRLLASLVGQIRFQFEFRTLTRLIGTELLNVIRCDCLQWLT